MEPPKVTRKDSPDRIREKEISLSKETEELEPLKENKIEKPKPEELEPLNVVEEPEIREEYKMKQWVATLAVCLGAFTAGTFLAWTSSALEKLERNSTDCPLDEPINKSQGMWIGSCLAIGALFTAFLFGILADKIGRKNVLLLLICPCVISWIIIIFAKKVEALYGARLLAGFAVGGICVTVPLYIGEIAEKKIRGALGSCFQLLLTVGILYSYIVGAFFSYKWLNIFCGIIPVLLLFSLFFIPETPYYYVYKNKNSLAAKSIKWLSGKHYNFDYKLKFYVEEVVEAKKNKATCKELLATKSNRKALFIALGLMFFQQLCGVNAVIFYTSQIFKFAGSSLRPEMCAIIVGGVQVVATFVSIFLVDKLGRKILLLFSGSIMSFCLIIFGVYFYLQKHHSELAEDIGWIPLFAVNVFILCFSLGYGPLPWMMIGELFPSNIKGLAGGLAVTLNWLLVFVVTKTFQDLISFLGTAGTFWFFGCITLGGIFFVIFVVKETKGKSFAEIQKLLEG